MTLIHPVLKYALVVAYLYGASVHVANMAGLTGFDWSQAPFKWQALDVVYLVLDVTVVIGLLFAPRLGLASFTVAAVSQIVLYTALRSWILNRRSAG